VGLMRSKDADMVGKNKEPVERGGDHKEESIRVAGLLRGGPRGSR
jgi:hypothetical protein